MRKIIVEATWRSKQEVEVEDDTEPIGAGDLDALLDAGVDIDSSGADLVDWNISDPAY